MPTRRLAGALTAALVVTGLLAPAGAPPALAVSLPGQISTFAGTIGEGVATSIAQRPRSMAARGTKVYVGSESNYVIRELDTETGIQRVIAGNGFDERNNPATRGESGSARDASLGYIEALAVDAAGNVYAADSANFYVRKITPQGTISIVAGNGTQGMSGDGGPARKASLSYMSGLAVDPAGNLYISDTYNYRIRRVDPAGVITTVVGNGTNDKSVGVGDGRRATEVPVVPRGLAVDQAGRLHFGDVLNGRVRALLADGTLATVAGGGTNRLPSVGGIPAPSANLHPIDLAFAPDGSLYVADVYFASRIDLAAQTVARVAGTGAPQYYQFHTGERTIEPGQLAVNTAMNAPQHLTVTANGDLYIGEMFEGRVFRVSAGGVITHVAGTGYFHLAGDGGPASAAMFSQARDMLVDPAGGIIIADEYNQRVRRIDPSGRITTIAGSGDTYGGFGGDGGPATSARLSSPSGVALDVFGNLYIADELNHRIRKVDPLGTITTFAEIPWFEGKYTQTGGIAVDLLGNVYLSQVWPRRILKFNLLGQVTTLTGSNEYDVSSTVTYPQGLALSLDGFLYVADTYGSRVQKVNVLTGATTSVAPGLWTMPTDVTVDLAGNVYVADGPLVRRVEPTGRVVTVAGTGVRGSTGDGGPATSARISSTAVAMRGSDLLIMDAGAGEVIRRVAGVDGLLTDLVRATGWNVLGMLGTGLTGDRKALVAAGGLRDAISVAAGALHTLVARRDGTVWASGWNAVGTLGTGTSIDSASFVPIPGMTGVKSVAAGWYHSLAVKADGTVWAWGWSPFGQLGDGTTTTRLSPVQVPGLTNVVAVSAGLHHSVALKADGTVWTWGWNAVGQLGLGHTADRHTPTQVPGLAGVRSISAGGAHSLAATTGGTLLTWGWNANGQLGNGTTADRWAPQAVTSVPGAVQVAGGLLHSAVVGASGGVWTFGWNGLGQLGDGTTADRHQPKQVHNLPGIQAVAAGAGHTVALTGTQGVRAWGWNDVGQLGDGSTTSRLSPTIVAGLEGVLSISAGYAHTAAG
jgi:sugar lactone lactonase YvrE